MIRIRKKCLISSLLILVFILVGCSSDNGESEIIQPQIMGKLVVSNKTAKSITNLSQVNQLANNVSIKKTEAKQNIKIPNKRKKQEKYKKEEIIIKYKKTTSLNFIKNLEKKNDLKQISKTVNKNNKVIHYKLPTGKTVKEVINEYQNNSNIAYVQPNYIYHINQIPNDRYYQAANNSNGIYQWGPINLNLEAAWDQETGSKEVTIAVIDSGIIPDHPDLADNISAGGYDFVDNDSEPYDLTRQFGQDDSENKYEVGSHGTHVAGIIGAVTNNSLGIAGTNWNVNIVPIRVIDTTGSGSSKTIVKGIKYAAGESIDITDNKSIMINKKVDIINLSLGASLVEGSNFDENMRNAIGVARENGVLVFAASGNGGPEDQIGDEEVFDPASYDTTVAVGAVGFDNERASYSNYGPKLDLVAPGNVIHSTWGYYDSSNNFTKEYKGLTGTSMATPYVSGVAGLLLAHGVSPDDVVDRLKNTAVDLGPSGRDNEYGYGLVDAYGALLGKKLAPPKVFAATKEGDTLIVQSEIETVANGEVYDLNHITGDEIYLVGWRDVDSKGTVNAGDYYGEVGPIPIKDQVQTINLQMGYISSSNFGLSLKVDNR